MIAIRRMTSEDVNAVDALQSAAPEAAHWPAAEYLPHIGLVAQMQESIVGCMVLQDLTGHQYEVLTLVVAEAARRCGIGSQLVHTARAIYSGEYFLEVREQNAVARRFYETLGFREIGRRPGYYSNPSDSAIVMRQQQ